MLSKDRCKHFTGYQNIVCEAGVTYRSLVGGPDQGWLRRLPCLLGDGQHDQPICERFELPTDDEIAADKARVDALVAETVRRINEGLCPECGEKPARERQVGRCVYAEPCGHRMYQGRARR